MKKLLFIEDDFNLANDIAIQLRAEGFDVSLVYDGLLAEKSLKQHDYDCIILDVNIPGINGYQLCKIARTLNIRTPIIMLTAFGEVDDKLAGFDAGADDYLTKPFYFKELLARIQALLKRHSAIDKDKRNVIIDDLVIDGVKKQVSRGNELIKLTAREFEIVRILAENQHNPVSKKDLIKSVWGTSFEVNTNTIEVFINTLRKKIDKEGKKKLIRTKMGFGYYLSADNEF